MSFNKTKFDKMREGLEQKRLEEIKSIGESVVVPAGTELKCLSCITHGNYQTRLTPCGTEGLRAALFGGDVKEFVEHRACPSCVAEIDARCASEKQAVDVMEKNEIRERGFRERIQSAGVSARHSFFTLDEIKAVNGHQDKALTIAEGIISSLKNKEAAPNLIMTGSVGTGKSLIAAATVQSAIREGLSARISTVMHVIRKFRATWKKDCDYTESEYIDHLTKVDLLVLDEVGVQYGSDSEKLFVFDVIDGRYRNMLPTILISNLNLDGIRECVGERCVDRMREDGGKVVAFDFESQRGKA